MAINISMNIFFFPQEFQIYLILSLLTIITEL